MILPCFFSQNAVIFPFFSLFYNIFFFLINVNGAILTHKKIFTFATVTKVRMLCYLLAQYVIMTSL